jgi:hypothetical protein
MAILKAAAVLAALAPLLEAAQLRASDAKRTVTWSRPGRFAKECGPVKRRNHRFHRRQHRRLSLAQNPGVGMDPESITPFETIFMDDYSFVECAKDELFSVGDKWGDGKFDYKVENTYNVSIIHYADTIPSEDQELMSQKLCYEFCRTVPGMSFFGLTHGRDCYCAPFYHAVAGDSSACDLPCKGSAVPAVGMCGGESKSALFEMHMCDATADDLAKSLTLAAEFTATSENLTKSAMTTASGMQVAAEEGQMLFGEAGDPVASDLMQECKEWAGVVEHAAEDLEAKTAELSELVKTAEGLEGSDFTSSDAALEAEAVMAEMAETSEAGAKLYDAADEVYELSVRGMGEDRGGEYYPLMYFVDKEYEDVPSTCGGTWDGHSIYGVTIDECATACDVTKVEPDCSGFFYTKSLCLLFSKFKSVTYYTGCKEVSLHARKVVKEHSVHGAKLGNFSYDTGCFAKLEDFVNTNLSPDPTGKNKLALKEVTKADRCFE